MDAELSIGSMPSIGLPAEIEEEGIDADTEGIAATVIVEPDVEESDMGATSCDFLRFVLGPWTFPTLDSA